MGTHTLTDGGEKRHAGCGPGSRTWTRRDSAIGPTAPWDGNPVKQPPQGPRGGRAGVGAASSPEAIRERPLLTEELHGQATAPASAHWSRELAAG